MSRHRESWEHGFDGWPRQSREPEDGDYARHATTNRNVRLHTSPHYTDREFARAQTVFGRRVDGLHYDYSDRLWEWDWDKAEASAKAANESGAVDGSANWHDAFMTHYRGRAVEVLHVLAGYNVATGYPYYVLGYRDKAPRTDGVA